MAKRGTVRVGVGGWTFEPWRGTFYPDDLPQKKELSYAARALTAIEINGTYYRSQKPSTFAAWRDAAPDGFVFSVKAPRFSTSRKVLAEAGDSIRRFVEGGLAELGDKLGPVLWQFPPTKRFEPDDFAAFLALLPDQTGGLALRHVLELRHDSFRDPEAVALLRKRGAAAVWAVDSEFPVIADITTDFVYIRLMGTNEREPLGYSPSTLDQWAARLAALSEGASPDNAELLADPAPRMPRDVFCFVIAGHKVINPAAAKALIERLD